MNLAHYILGDDNRPIEVDWWTWALWFEDANRTVDYTEITSACRVSTVFLGLDHRFIDKGPPLLFETLIMGDHPLAGEGARYSTWDDAEIGHKRWVRKARAAIGQKVGGNP